jgi:Ferritin-like domain
MKLLNTSGTELTDNGHDLSRRRFLGLAGGIAGAGMLLASCRRSGPTDTYIGTGDTALLNFIYIMQQLEADFYTQAVATPNLAIDKDELTLLTDVRDQEIAHKEFIQTLLGVNAINAISANFSTVTFIDRTSVYNFAATLEDLSEQAINSTVARFSDQSYAVEVAKMLTVEARHSAYFRDIYSSNTFASNGIVDTNGLGPSGTPSAILATAQSYILTHFDSRQLP